MAVTLALLEGAVLFLATGLGIVLWDPLGGFSLEDVEHAMVPALTTAACCIVPFYYHDLYDLRITRNFTAFAPRLVQSLGVSFLLLALVYSLFPDIGIGGRPFYSSMLIMVGLVLPLRAGSYAIMRSRPFAERTVILGTGALARKIAQEIEAAPNAGYLLCGFVEEGPSGSSDALGLPVVGPMDKLEWIVQTLKPGRIVVAQTERRGRMPIRELLDARFAGVRIEDGVEVYERLTQKLAIESLVPSTLIFADDFKKSKVQLGLRRLVSLGAATVGLLATAPLMLLIAFAIKLDSRGPVFFIQARAGLNGRHISLIKFRTMHPMVSGGHSVFARDDAARITRVGKWLRKVRLDELPQFVNILRGDMDFIGPRPEMASNVPTLLERIPYYSLRFVVRPGVTGWAQIRHGYSVSEEDVTEKMRYDLYYIKRMSLGFDLRILVDTVKIVLFGRGAR